MPRHARIVVPGLPHHVTQRGVRRQDIFFEPGDREYYLHWLKEYARKTAVEILSYCLMTNHVHHILVPDSKTALANLFKPLHVRYAIYINKKYEWTGHLWQARFYSSPLDDEYLWTAIRYVEQNPVKARIVKHASDYPWSSAAAHCELRSDSLLTRNQHWCSRKERISDWYEWLSNDEDDQKIDKLRARTARDFPCGSDSFRRELEQMTGRSFEVRRRGRPRNSNK